MIFCGFYGKVVCAIVSIRRHVTSRYLCDRLIIRLNDAQCNPPHLLYPFKISFLSKGAQSLKHFSNACSTTWAATPLQTGLAWRDNVARRFAHSGKPFVNCIRPLIISLNTLHSPLNDDARICTLFDFSCMHAVRIERTPYLSARMLLAL